MIKIEKPTAASGTKYIQCTSCGERMSENRITRIVVGVEQYGRHTVLSLCHSCMEILKSDLAM